MTPCRRTSSGSRASACFTRLFTFSAALSASAPMPNVTWISSRPFEPEFEDMKIMSSTPVSWFSSGAATVCSIVCADAPG